MSPRPSLFAGREQALSGFAAPLGRLCEALPARAAAVVDHDGETIDYAGSLDGYVTKIAAAELQLLVQGLNETRYIGASKLRQLVVRATHATLAAVPLAAEYTLIVHLPPAAFSLSRRALSQAVRELCVEGGITVPGEYRREQWVRVRVEDDVAHSWRPRAIWMQDAWTPLEVFGRVQNGDLARGEVAYRVHLASGEEATLVREPLGRWFSEHSLRV
jgi:hypothetical protein